MRFSLLFALVLSTAFLFAQQTSDPWQSVAQALGRSGKEMPGGVYKVSMPRSDMHVTVEGVELKPALALGAWLAFTKMGAEAMVMGDLVLSEDEVGPVMMKLQQGGIEQTALHNHVLHESPRVMYMHVSGHGDPAALAKTLREALTATSTPAPNPNPPAAAALAINADVVGAALGGRKATVNGGVLQFSVPRSEKIMDEGSEIPPAMGTATAINFQPTGENKAAVTGDFVLLGSEVNPVIRALRDGGIQVTAIHSHMLTETPRLFFMHFWANDDAGKLAKVLNSALEKTNSTKK